MRPESVIEEIESLASVETPETLETLAAATTAANNDTHSPLTSDNETAKNDDLGLLAETSATPLKLGEDQGTGVRQG